VVVVEVDVEVVVVGRLEVVVTSFVVDAREVAEMVEASVDAVSVLISAAVVS